MNKLLIIILRDYLYPVPIDPAHLAEEDYKLSFSSEEAVMKGLEWKVGQKIDMIIEYFS